MTAPHSRTFGALVRQLRDERGWTQEQLAREAGITVTSVSNLERGATQLPNAETVERLAAAFGLEPGDLDPRWLADLVIHQASTFPVRQAIKGVLALPDRGVEAVLELLAELERPSRKPRRR